MLACPVLEAEGVYAPAGWRDADVEPPAVAEMEHLLETLR